MKKIELVFRTVGERTADQSLRLAIEHIRPDRVHVIENVRPFSEAVRQMLQIDHACDHVVHMDADCLILEDLRPFLELNTAPYVDCYVLDRFRGNIHCGVHITRADVVRFMRDTPFPAEDLAFVLRPESRLRNIAMRARGMRKAFKNFHILHDHFQWYRDIFAKYALRELRSRTASQAGRLAGAMARWGDGPDFAVARAAVTHARDNVPADARPADKHAYIAALGELARRETAAMDLPEQPPFTEAQLAEALASDPAVANRPRAPRVFGLGLSRTGTRSLTTALRILGIDCIHYPMDETTFQELAEARYDFSLLKIYDGLTDITVAPFYAQLDRRYPGAKFILTVRDKAAWLRSCKLHWEGRDPFEPARSLEQHSHMKIRRLLRAATYGCYTFDEERFSWVWDHHVKSVQEHFRGRPEDLLVLDVCAGSAWEPLCRFLGREIPPEPFPHKGGALSRRVATGERRKATGLEVMD